MQFEQEAGALTLASDLFRERDLEEPKPQYLSIKNWRKFQPLLKNGQDCRDWIRLNTRLEDDPAYNHLGWFAQHLLVGLWRLRGRTGKNILNDPKHISIALQVAPTARPRLPHAILTLISRGFLVVSNQQIDEEFALQDKTRRDKTNPPNPPHGGNGHWKPNPQWPVAPAVDGKKLTDEDTGICLAISKAGRWTCPPMVN